MVNELLTGISVKLNQVFGAGYEIYGDTDVIQGLTEPCFFIAVLQPTQKNLVGLRYIRENPFDIQYFPATAGNNTELHSMGSDLFEALEFIQLLNEDLVHGTSMEYEIIDGVLHFKVSYNMIVKLPYAEDDMETLDVDVSTTTE